MSNNPHCGSYGPIGNHFRDCRVSDDITRHAGTRPKIGEQLYTADQFLLLVNKYADAAERHVELAVKYSDTLLELAAYRRAYGSRPVDVPPADAKSDAFVEYCKPPCATLPWSAQATGQNGDTVERREYAEKLFDANMPHRESTGPSTPTLRVPSVGKLPAIIDPAKVARMNVVIDTYGDLPCVVGEWPTVPGWYWLWTDNSAKWQLVEYDRYRISQLPGKPDHVPNWRRIGPLPVPPSPAR